MLVRRIIERARAQDWSAVLLEFVIVVIGVFIGLQVQEWSTARAERSAERAAIERLIVEYEQNLVLLADDRARTEKAHAATARLLSMIAPEPDPGITDDSIAQTLLDCLTNPKYVPTVGTTQSLVASGDLRLIRDPEIQRMLTQWPATVQVMTEWQAIERVHGEELIVGLTLDYLAWPTIGSALAVKAAPSRLQSDYQGLFSSKRFEGLLFNRWYNTRVSMQRMDDLRGETEVLIARLNARLAEL
jgi:hypothetical protein